MKQAMKVMVKYWPMKLADVRLVPDCACTPRQWLRDFIWSYGLCIAQQYAERAFEYLCNYRIELTFPEDPPVYPVHKDPPCPE